MAAGALTTQIVGNFFDEPRVIQAAHAFEQALGGGNRLPGLLG